MSNEADPHHIDVHVGQRVRLRRKQLGISQSGLADALGLTFQQVQKYEKGSNRVSASKLFEIAGKLDVRISYFFEGLEGQSSAKGTAPADLASMAAMIAVPEIAMLPDIPREAQVALGKVIQAMAPEAKAEGKPTAKPKR